MRFFFPREIALLSTRPVAPAPPRPFMKPEAALGPDD